MPVFLLRNILLGVPAMFIEEAQGQALLTLVILLFFSIIQAHVWPWRSEDLNWFDTYACCMLMLMIVTWFPTTDEKVSFTRKTDAENKQPRLCRGARLINS